METLASSPFAVLRRNWGKNKRFQKLFAAFRTENHTFTSTTKKKELLKVMHYIRIAVSIATYLDSSIIPVIF